MGSDEVEGRGKGRVAVPWQAPAVVIACPQGLTPAERCPTHLSARIHWPSRHEVVKLAQVYSLRAKICSQAAWLQDPCSGTPRYVLMLSTTISQGSNISRFFLFSLKMQHGRCAVAGCKWKLRSGRTLGSGTRGCPCWASLKWVRPLSRTAKGILN